MSRIGQGIKKSILTANSVLYAVTARVPAALSMAALRILGRKSSGNIVGLTAAELRTIISVENGSTADQTGDEIVTLLEALAGAAQLSHTKISDVGATDHHDNSTDHVESHDLASHSTKAHSELSDAPEGAHHTKFTTTEHSSIGNGAPHHTKYVDASAVSAVEAAGLTFAENKGIILDALLSGDGTWSGITEAGIAGATIAVGDLVYLAVADTRWELADADAEATAFGKLGICILAANDGAATNVLLYGKVRSAVFPTFTVGAPVHVGTTAGDVQVTAPTGTNKVVRIVGYGNTAEDLFFCPDNTYIKLA